MIRFEVCRANKFDRQNVSEMGKEALWDNDKTICSLLLHQIPSHQQADRTLTIPSQLRCPRSPNLFRLIQQTAFVDQADIDAHQN